MNITELKDHSYTPYSNTNAVALVRSNDGTYFPGCRVENASYPVSISAVQNALFCCISEGYTPQVVWASNDDPAHRDFWISELGVAFKVWDSGKLKNTELVDLTLDIDISPKNELVSLLDDAVVEESDFPVAALLKTEQGFFSAVNIECSAWNMGLCAERIAIAKALAYGSEELKALYIHTRNGEFSSPCGACRQVIIEHMPDRKIHLYHADHSTSVHFSTDLLPYNFQSTSLNNN